jgi:subtilisin family serine protease
MRPAPLFTAIALLLGACNDTLSPPAPADAPVQSGAAHRRAGQPIPGRYIVVFRRDVVATESVARGLAAKHNGKLKHTYRAALKGMAVELPDGAAAALRQDPAVEYVEQDQVARVSGEPIVQPGATTGLDRIDQRFLPLSGTYSYSTDGSGVRVYILDTGIYQGHAEFAGRALPGFDAITPGGNADDCHGHGTHVAGTVGGTTYGVAKKVQLYAVRVLDCAGSGSYSAIIAGIDWVTTHRVLPAVANMSIGGPISDALNQAVSNSIAAGVTYAIAAMNETDDACYYSPASTRNAITVAASDVRDNFAYFSNYGSCVDIIAPGVNITSAGIGSPGATRMMNGTSMATPHVAGAAALYLASNPGSTPAQVTSALLSNATPGVISGQLTGTPNALLYSAFGSPSSWQAQAGMPTARGGVALWDANGLLYAIGGANSAGTVLRTVQAYNPATNSWTTKAPLPAARQSGNGAGEINKIIYLAGGHDAAGALTRTLYAYNSATNTWGARAQMPIYSSCGGSGVSGGKLYVFSGCTRSSTGAQVAAKRLHRYDPVSNTWTALPNAPVVHYQPVVGFNAGKLYVVGGNNGSGAATGRVDMYDPATNTWATRATMPTPRVGAAGVSIGGKLYVMGGRNGTTYLNTVQAYDPVTNSWSTGASMPTARAAFGVAGISGFLYAVGGRSASTAALGTNERFTP